MKTKTNNNSSGFTIVELLIVVIIIGILVSIIIVVYRGVQQRAANTQTISVVTQYVKSLKQYAADNNKYPEPFTDGTDWSCLGIGYPNNQCFATGSLCYGIGPVSPYAWFNDAVKPYQQNKTPTTSLQLVPCISAQMRGAAFLSNWPALGYAGIFYVISDNKCSAPGGQLGYTWVALDNGGMFCYLILDKP